MNRWRRIKWFFHERHSPFFLLTFLVPFAKVIMTKDSLWVQRNSSLNTWLLLLIIMCWFLSCGNGNTYYLGFFFHLISFHTHEKRDKNLKLHLVRRKSITSLNYALLDWVHKSLTWIKNKHEGVHESREERVTGKREGQVRGREGKRQGEWKYKVRE